MRGHSVWESLSRRRTPAGVLMKIEDARKAIAEAKERAERIAVSRGVTLFSNVVLATSVSDTLLLAEIAERSCDINELAKWAEAIYGGWVGLLENLGDDRCSQHNQVHLRAHEHTKLLADLRAAHLKMQEAVARFDAQERGENS